MSVRRIVVTGSECTGKTTLAAALAERLDGLSVPEAAREAALAKNGALGPEDVEPIARAHMAAADAALEEARRGGARLVILDQDLFSTVVYALHYYGSCPAWIQAVALERRADLYLLCHPDIPWVADSVRDRPDLRDEIHTLFAGALASVGAKVVNIYGPADKRLARALARVDGGGP